MPARVALRHGLDPDNLGDSVVVIGPGVPDTPGHMDELEGGSLEQRVVT